MGKTVSVDRTCAQRVLIETSVTPLDVFTPQTVTNSIDRCDVVIPIWNNRP